MRVTFWGTRGSIPTAISAETIKQKIRQALEGAAGLNLADAAVREQYLARLPFTVQHTLGGETTCIELQSGGQTLIIDAGSGLRRLGLHLMGNGAARGGYRADLLLTHTHWDHIQGWPFFGPAFVPGNHFTFHSPFPDLARRLEGQQHDLYFPVPLSYMQATLDFRTLAPGEWHQLGRFRVRPLRVSHPGEAYGYRIEDGDSSLVCATDSEYKRVDPASTAAFIDFFHQSDLLIFDAQYGLSEVLDKPDWGHSTPIMGAELAHRAGVKRLALFHHDPTSSDEKVWAGKEQAEAYLLRRHPQGRGCEILIAYDGLALDI